MLPLVDACCDLLGTNSQCPYFYSAQDDGAAQAYDGMPTWCNPPFSDAARFVRALEES